MPFNGQLLLPRRQLGLAGRRHHLFGFDPNRTLLACQFSTADNYCFYVDNYDSLGAAYDWARQTLEDHSKDKREHLYTR